MRGVMIETETAWTFRTPHGNPVTFALRPGSSDWNTANSCCGENDEYHLPTGLSGWALDVGAHIGACAVPLLLDNPDLRVVAIEALPENATLLRENLRMNGVADRCIVLEGAAGDGKPTRIGYGPRSGDLQHSEFIGSMHAPETADFIEVPGFSLMDAYNAADLDLWKSDDGFVWVKSDCEGGEYPFFGNGGSALGRLAFITGEHHFGYSQIEEILAATHDVTMTSGEPSFGHFEAVRKP